MKNLIIPGAKERRIALAAAVLLVTGTALAATRTWDGSSSGLWTTAANWSGNVAPVNGDLLAFPAGPARLNTTNSAGGATNFTAISFTGSNYVLVSPPLSLTNGLTNLVAAINATNTLRANLTPSTNQTWAVGNRNTLILSSNVTIGAFKLTADLAGTLIVDGVISGGAGSSLIKEGNGRLEINSSATIAQWSIDDGTLQVDGQLAGGLTIGESGLLAGSGSVSPFSCSGAVMPGQSGPGQLSVSAGVAVFNASSLFQLNLNGLTPGTQHDQLRVSSPPILSGATLSLIRNPAYTPAVGDKLVIITNTGAAAFTTTFVNLPQGARITNNTPPVTVFEISYTGGNGNDVVLTVPCDAPPAPGNLQISDLGPAPSRVSIVWNAVTPCGPAIAEYVLFRDGLEVGRNTSPGVVDPLMIAGHTYTFRAAAVDTNGAMSALSTGLVVTALPPNPIVGTQKVVNLLVRFSDFPAEPFGTNHPNNLMFNATNSVRAYYEEVSGGRFSIRGASYGWFTLPGTASNYCTLFFEGNPEGYGCDSTDIRNDTLALLPAAVSNEVASADVVNLVVLGMGTVGLSGGRYKLYSATNGFSPGVVIHEITHGLNATLHAGSWDECEVYPVGPDILNLTNGGCRVSRYGDRYDPMGGGTTFHHNTWYKERLGWMGPGTITAITTNGEYLLHRVETPTNKTQMLTFDLGHEMFYFFEYRTPTGMDGPSSPDLGSYAPIDQVLAHLRVSRYAGTDAETFLLTRLFQTAPAFLDPYRGLLVELLEKTNGVARLRVNTNYQHTLRITDLHRVGPSNRNVSLTWNSVPGVHHFVEASTNLSNWQSVATFIYANGIATTNVINNVGTNRHRFFRVQQYLNP